MHDSPVQTIQPPLLVSLLLLSAGCYSRPLSGDEIEVLLSGAEVQGRHTLHGYSFDRSYDPEGTFRQVRRGRTEPETARWWIHGDQICIRWDHEARDLCRTLRTDDRGALWKTMRKRNGETARVLTYTSVIGPDGTDRLTPIPTAQYLRRWPTTLPGILSGVGLVGLSLMLGVLVGVRGDNPHSLGNTLAWWIPWKIGGRWIWPPRLSSLDPTELDALTIAALIDREYVFVAWIVSLQRRRAPDEATAWGWLWRPMSTMEDGEIGVALRSLLHVLPSAGTLLEAIEGNERAMWLLSRAFTERARQHQRSNASRFESDKQSAITLLTPLHGREASPPLSTLGRTPGSSDYLALAGPAMEELLYLKAQVSTGRGSSSYAGGG